MSESFDLLLVICIFAAAVLYSSVGHGGGSGYLAAMALFGLAPSEMRPASLALNILVASIGTVRFYRAGCFSWRLYWPFAAASIPCAFVGGAITLPGDWYKRIVGLVLLFAAYRLFTTPSNESAKRVPVPLALVCGAGIGLLSGLTGTGGGIFLTPLLLLTRWAETRQAAGVSVAFILANSIAGILGLLTTDPIIPSQLPYWAIAAVGGGLIGSELGSRRLQNKALRRLLALVLVIAAFKLIGA